MKFRSIEAVWMASAFSVAFFLAASMLAAFGVNERGVHAALAATARFMFLLFWPAYSAGALVSLFGAAFQPLRQYARVLGLAFASALLVHLGLVGLVCLIGFPPPVATFVFFGIGATLAYLLAVFSIRRLHQALGAKYWRLLSLVGMNYLAYAFIVDFVKDPFSGSVRHGVEYIPFAALAITGPCLRLAALVQRVGRKWRDQSYG